MALYRVWAQSISDVYLDVEAESPEEAIQIADATDGGDFIDSSYGDWILNRDPDMVDVLDK